MGGGRLHATLPADAIILGARDALPADNEAIAPPTKVNR